MGDIESGVCCDVCGKKFDKAKINFKNIFILFNYLVLQEMDER